MLTVSFCIDFCMTRVPKHQSAEAAIHSLAPSLPASRATYHPLSLTISRASTIIAVCGWSHYIHY